MLIKTNEILKFHQRNGIYLIIPRLKIPKAKVSKFGIKIELTFQYIVM